MWAKGLTLSHIKMPITVATENCRRLGQQHQFALDFSLHQYVKKFIYTVYIDMQMSGHHNMCLCFRLAFFLCSMKVWTGFCIAFKCAVDKAFEAEQRCRTHRASFPSVLTRFCTSNIWIPEVSLPCCFLVCSWICFATTSGPFPHRE